MIIIIRNGNRTRLSDLFNHEYDNNNNNNNNDDDDDDNNK